MPWDLDIFMKMNNGRWLTLAASPLVLTDLAFIGFFGTVGGYLL
jgi:hypothetical protein